MCKTLHCARRSWMHWFCICFCVRCGQDLRFSPMAESTITQDCIAGLGSLVCICGRTKSTMVQYTEFKHLSACFFFYCASDTHMHILNLLSSQSFTYLPCYKNKVTKFLGLSNQVTQKTNTNVYNACQVYLSISHRDST